MLSYDHSKNIMTFKPMLSIGN